MSMSYDEINRLFDKATRLVKKAPLKQSTGPMQLLQPPHHIQIELYGLYKQATSQPFLPSQDHSSPTSRQKLEAWERCSTLTPQDCRLQYLVVLYPVLYRWASLPLRTLAWYLSPLSSSERKAAESSLVECRELIELLNAQPTVINSTGIFPSSEPFPDEESADKASEFSFEELFFPNPQELLSSERPFDTLKSHQPISTREPRIRRQRSFSTISANSAELVPTVPFTPNFGPTLSRGISRRLSVVSISNSSLPSRSPTRLRSRAQSITSQNDFSARHSINDSTGNWGAPPQLRDETSALIQSTSQRLGQGMALVRKSLQRLERLEEKVDGALHRKLQPTSPCPSPTEQPSIDASLSGWITKMYHNLLQ
ncbi:hypothetical protein DSO57_1039531 [Entomophthora muscae]|uniref:Uncharacterized protein n=1 Tax=Entomophthora muscae TaxID=34485 RepID=A0ACC2RP83_9FUNG|nr:hypothetical protein DSO57_1039531 [Entomophthora muscae]